PGGAGPRPRRPPVVPAVPDALRPGRRGRRVRPAGRVRRPGTAPAGAVGPGGAPGTGPGGVLAAGGVVGGAVPARLAGRPRPHGRLVRGRGAGVGNGPVSVVPAVVRARRQGARPE